MSVCATLQGVRLHPYLLHLRPRAYIDQEFALSSETARARNRAQVGSNTSSLQESPPPLKAPAGLLGGFNDSLQGMALPGLQNFADNYSTMFTSAFPTGSTTASRPV